MIDLRSDTITQPTPEMRQVMANAQVGDDVLGDDPTVRALEERVANLLGKSAALFVPSGTMANQIAVRTHTQPGDEILLHPDSHIYYYEAGATAALSGVISRLIPGPNGIFTPKSLTQTLRPSDPHFAPARLLCVENTHNRGGGSLWMLDQTRDICNTARKANLKIHLDGARLWNAAVATDTPEIEFASHFDSVSVCFSKGLGAPVGSALAGDADFIHTARRFRKQFGGGMRQAGILAAAALYAIDHHRDRLADDHQNARTLANLLTEIPPIHINPADTQTNIVRFDTPNHLAPPIADAAEKQGLLLLATGPNTLRAVTNLSVTADDIRSAAGTLKKVLAD